MHKIYIPESISGVAQPLFITPLSAQSSRLFQSIPAEEYAGIFQSVSVPEEADFIVAPHEYADLQKKPRELAAYRSIADAAQKPLIISAYQDDPAPIHEENARILRPSAYKSRLQKNEFIMPGYVEDIGKARGVRNLPKGKQPTVGFAGKAGFASVEERVKYLLRNYLLRQGVDRQGVYFRRRALAALERDTRIALRQIVRKNFSANRKTVEVTPEQARAEYIENIEQTLCTLAPRGDGNFSFRFFEVLSCGRIPLLIDTDMALPLEDRIAYDEFIIRVPWQDVERVGDYVMDFFTKHDDGAIEAMQQKARSAFETHLYMPRFLDTLFTHYLT